MSKRRNITKRILAVLLSAQFVLSSTSSVLGEAATEKTETLPVTWNLEEVYSDADAWQEDYDRAMELLDQYESFCGTLNTAENIYNYLEFSAMGELTRLEMKLNLYAELGSSLDPTNMEFKNMMRMLDSMTAKEKELSAFADPEIYALPLETREKFFQILFLKILRMR